MKWVTIAKKDFRDAARAKTLWGLTVLFILFAGGVAYSFAEVQQGGSGDFTTNDLIFFLVAPVAILVPIASVIAGQRSIVGERETGSMKILMSLPYSRRDLVLGKLVGRASVIALSIGIGFTIATIIILLKYQEFSFFTYILFVIATILLGIAYVSIAVGISAMSKSSTRVAAGVIGVFIFFQFLWGSVPNVIHQLVYGSFTIGSDRPGWIGFLGIANPDGAHARIVAGLLPDSSSIQGRITLEDAPLYLSEWAALCVLLFWILLPVVIGYLQLISRDL